MPIDCRLHELPNSLVLHQHASCIPTHSNRLKDGYYYADLFAKARFGHCSDSLLLVVFAFHRRVAVLKSEVIDRMLGLGQNFRFGPTIRAKLFRTMSPANLWMISLISLVVYLLLLTEMLRS